MSYKPRIRIISSIYIIFKLVVTLMKFKQFIQIAMLLSFVEATYNFIYDLFNIEFSNDSLVLVGIPFLNFISIPLQYLVISCVAWPIYSWFIFKNK